MITFMKKTGLWVAVSLLAAAALGAREKAASPPADPSWHPAITDPKVYIPLREEMTAMEMRFVDVQIMAAEDKVDFKAVQKALEEMETASKKIRKINPSDVLREPLEKLGSQLEGLQRNARRKDLAALKGNLDLLFQTCFKCHQSHAPLMKETP